MQAFTLYHDCYVPGCCNIDESHNAKHWCIMAELKLLKSVIHKKKSGCGSKSARF